MTERRSEQRFLDTELAMLSWEEDGNKFQQLANVCDVSSCGMCLLVDFALEVDTPVTIAYGEEGELFGTIRHHAQSAYGIQLGVEFVGVSRNSTLHFQPELLLREK